MPRRLAVGVVFVLLWMMASPAAVVGRCVPGRSNIQANYYYGRGADHTSSNNQIQTIEAEAENDGESGFYPYIAPGATTSSFRLEMWSTRSEGIWYNGARMVMELQWSGGQGRPESSSIYIYINEEKPPHRVIVSSHLRLGDLQGIDDYIWPKIEEHTHSLEFSEHPNFQVDDLLIWYVPQTAAPNGFRFSRMVVHIQNAASQVPGDGPGDLFNIRSAKWQRASAGWATYPFSTNQNSNTWGSVGWTTLGGMNTSETFC